jgi:uncharacterized lipoprotein YehR (DUF1307 family)
MKPSIFTVVLAAIVPLAVLGCGNADNSSSPNAGDQPLAAEIDEAGQFELMLKEVDKVIGERFQSMQMGAMTSVSYQYDGSIDKVVDVVEPMAIKAGYLPMDDDTTEQSFAEGHKQMQQMTNMKMKMIGSKTYMHEDGNLISISRMDISSDAPKMQMNMQMLTVQMMNPKKNG